MRATKTWRAWTTKELLRLSELRGRGKTAAQIAKTLNRTYASVKCRVQNEVAPLIRHRQEEWLNTLSRPHTLAGAASQMGVSKWAVKKAKRELRRAGFDIPAAIRGAA